MDENKGNSSNKNSNAKLKAILGAVAALSASIGNVDIAKAESWCTCSGCEGSCQEHCKGCRGDCNGCNGCSAACMRNCNSCGGCDSGCYSGCKNTCSTCSNGCSTCGDACSTSCTSCSGTCTTDCGGNCTGNCSSGCQGSCKESCQQCSNGCSTCTSCTSCSGGCGGSCRGGCYGCSSCGGCDSGCDSGCRATSMAKYTITLDNQGANVSAGTSQVTVVAGNNMTAIAIPSKRGYTFGGYYTLPKGEGTQYYSPTGASARVWDDIDSVSRTAMTRHYNKKISDTCEDAQIRAVVG